MRRRCKQMMIRDMFCAIFVVVLGFLPTLVTADGDLFDCSWNNKSLSLAQKGSQIKIDHPQCIKLTWERVNVGNQLQIDSTNHVSVSYSFNTSIHITAELIESTACSATTAKLTVLLWFFPVLLLLKMIAVGKREMFVLLLLTICVSYGLSLKDCSSPSVHIKVPSNYVSRICINQKECIPTVCDLGIYLSDSKGYSTVSSNNRVLFEDDKCTIKKPEYWNEWVFRYFNKNITSKEFYLQDTDRDGLVNILEYYADQNFTKDNSIATENEYRVRRDAISDIGSDPTNADTDGDLLLDGFESYFGMSPIQVEDSSTDFDNDGLSNLQEQIYGTNPLNTDTDGDGASDRDEVNNNSDPLDPTDNGQAEDTDLFAIVKLTIGDPSGSHSERYNLNVGGISHQAPDFGVVGNGHYKFEPGRYVITVEWVATNINQPDYDYTASVSKVSGSVVLEVHDPDNILGTYYDSTYDRTIGKSAMLIVKVNCDVTQGDKHPSCFKTCIECSSIVGYIWDIKGKICRKRITLVDYIESIFEPFKDCSDCDECLTWYRKEQLNTAWLIKLNKDFPCPCRVEDNGERLVSANKNSSIQWDSDAACKRDGKSAWWFPGGSCMDYHPGAYGCMRADSTEGTRQQCCYDNNLNWISSGRGAGTPDKSSGVYGHLPADVWPFNNCCVDCKEEKYCKLYIDEVRKGPDSCSNTI